MSPAAPTSAAAAASPQVLQGIRVLDLGSFITAPYAAMLLGEMGADVVKVERPGAGDPFRAFQGGLYSSHFQGHNRAKRSLALDYAVPAGRAVLDRLVAASDVLLINVRPGVERKLGLDAERLQALHPGLVHCAITGYGASGPYADRPAYDNVGQSLSGWLSMFHQGADARVAGPAVSDAFTGVFAALGIAGALVERQRTGVGRRVEVSMLEATIAFATEPLARLFASGQPVPYYSRAASSQSYIVTCRCGGRIGLHLSSPGKFWDGLVAALDQPGLTARYPDRPARVRGYEALAGELAAIFATRDRDDWVPLLARHDVPFAPERRLEDLADDPQVQHLGVFQTLQHPTQGPVQAPARPIRFDGDNHGTALAPPVLGEHSDAVLAEAGYGAEAIADLRAQGVVA